MRPTRLLFLLLPLAAIGVGCSPPQQSAKQATADTVVTPPSDTAPPPIRELVTSLSDDSAAVLVRALEEDPLGEDATRLREELLQWGAASEMLQQFTPQTAPIDELQSSSYRYREELFLQYLLGAAAHAATPHGMFDVIEQQAAGIRSMLAAYRNIVQRDRSMTHPFLERLDDIRRRGELRSYIQQFKQQ